MNVRKELARAKPPITPEERQRRIAKIHHKIAELQKQLERLEQDK